MKKKVFTMAIAGLSIFSSFNCIVAQKGLRLGAEGTPQLSWLLNKDDQDNSKYENQVTMNVSFGLSSQYGFTEQIGIGLNALYSFQGQRYKLDGVERNKKIEYLKVPLMFTYTYDINSSLMFMGKIGPQLGVLMSAKLTDKDGNNIVSDHKEAYEDFDIGGVAYAGIGYKVNDKLCVHANLRFDYGFINAENNDYKLYVNDPIAPLNGNAGAVSNRAVTNNITAGLTIGIDYLLDFEKK